MIRLDKFISEQAVLSRKAATKMIYTGHVKVNDIVCNNPSFKFDPQTTKIALNDQELTYQKHLYLMMNKPEGVLSESNNPHAETVIDLIPDEYRRPTLFPVGRLDKNTTGLLLITDDGDWAHKILSPKNEIWKTYHAIIDKPITDEIIEAFEKGSKLPDGTSCRPAKLKLLQDGINPHVEITICEGKYHQVKRMFGTFEIGVNALRRVSIGNLKLDETLEEGCCRLLSENEQNDVFC